MYENRSWHTYSYALGFLWKNRCDIHHIHSRRATTHSLSARLSSSRRRRLVPWRCESAKVWDRRADSRFNNIRRRQHSSSLRLLLGAPRHLWHRTPFLIDATSEETSSSCHVASLANRASSCRASSVDSAWMACAMDKKNRADDPMPCSFPAAPRLASPSRCTLAHHVAPPLPGTSAALRHLQNMETITISSPHRCWHSTGPKHMYIFSPTYVCSFV
jgi:hypothetical protein